MEHTTFMSEYESRLAEHSWEAVQDLIHEDAVFIFSDGTFRGKSEISQAFGKTFETIQNEKYTIHNMEWLIQTGDIAVCIYEFQWMGMVKGVSTTGKGRGTTVLLKIGNDWKIIHEHLGPSINGST